MNTNEQQQTTLSQHQKEQLPNVEHFISYNRKNCWESHYESGEFCLGENIVRRALESVASRLETEMLKTNVANNSNAAMQQRIQELEMALNDCLKIFDIYQEYMDIEPGSQIAINKATELLQSSKQL